MQDKGEQLLKKIRNEEAVNQADFFDLGVLTFTDEVRKMCVQNACGRYGRTWNCPPVCGTVEELEAVCRGFKRGILVNCVKTLEDSFDWEGMTEGGAPRDGRRVFWAGVSEISGGVNRKCD